MNFYELRPNLGLWETATPSSCGAEYYKLGYVNQPDGNISVPIIPKCACSSILFTAAKHWYPNAASEMECRIKLVQPHERFHVIHRIATQFGMYQDRVVGNDVVGLIRHPAQRVKSGWQNQVSGHDVTTGLPHKMGFEEFLVHLSNQSPLDVEKHFRPFSLCLPLDTDLYTLENSLDLFCQRLDWDELESVNTSSENDTSTVALNRHHFEFISRLYAQDCRSHSDIFNFFENAVSD